MYGIATNLTNQRRADADALQAQSKAVATQRAQAELTRDQQQTAVTDRDQAVSDQADLVADAEELIDTASRKRSRAAKGAQRELRDLLDQGLFVPPSMDPTLTGSPVAERMVILARRELDKGVHEQPDGSNDSPDIARYRTATLGSGVGPWCAYFVSYIAASAGRPVQDGGRGEGGVDNLADWGRREGLWTPASDAHPAPGDIVIWDEHTGLVVQRVKGGQIYTIEGNSSNAVSAREHPVRQPLGYIRISGEPDPGNAGHDAKAPKNHGKANADEV